MYILIYTHIYLDAHIYTLKYTYIWVCVYTAETYQNIHLQSMHLKTMQ